jgi:hypothetical protein
VVVENIMLVVAYGRASLCHDGQESKKKLKKGLETRVFCLVLFSEGLVFGSAEDELRAS